jgi:hypothetical protein
MKTETTTPERAAAQTDAKIVKSTDISNITFVFIMIILIGIEILLLS